MKVNTIKLCYEFSSAVFQNCVETAGLVMEIPDLFHNYLHRFSLFEMWQQCEITGGVTTPLRG